MTKNSFLDLFRKTFEHLWVLMSRSIWLMHSINALCNKTYLVKWSSYLFLECYNMLYARISLILGGILFSFLGKNKKFGYNHYLVWKYFGSNILFTNTFISIQILYFYSKYIYIYIGHTFKVQLSPIIRKLFSRLGSFWSLLYFCWLPSQSYWGW